MESSDCDLIIKALYDAFSNVEKPSPLATYDEACDFEEVDIFNEIDWEFATYSDVVKGTEGLIVCPPITKVYLLPRLFRMVLQRQHGTPHEAVDNLSQELSTWPVEAEVEHLLTDSQKAAIISAWSYLGHTIYGPSGSKVVQKFAEHWQIEIGAK